MSESSQNGSRFAASLVDFAEETFTDALIEKSLSTEDKKLEFPEKKEFLTTLKGHFSSTQFAEELAVRMKVPPNEGNIVVTEIEHDLDHMSFTSISTKGKHDFGAARLMSRFASQDGEFKRPHLDLDWEIYVEWTDGDSWKVNVTLDLDE